MHANIFLDKNISTMFNRKLYTCMRLYVRAYKIVKKLKEKKPLQKIPQRVISRWRAAVTSYSRTEQYEFYSVRIKNCYREIEKPQRYFSSLWIAHLENKMCFRYVWCIKILISGACRISNRMPPGDVKIKEILINF